MASIKEALQKWLADYPAIFVAQEIPNGIVLREITTSKERSILYPQVTEWRRREHPEGLGDYMNLVFEEGHELALCHAGFAFSPSYLSTKSLNLLPEVVCFQDFYRLLGHLEHLYQNLSQREEAVKALTSCLAILEGARLVKFEVSEEERKLEEILTWLETH
ncbi:MAG: hypothetical protein HYY44_05640 [Deltaproteobacteria bacterium]|nr:hypothetical protein [Deltaproteobacteria bacterium]